MAPSSKPLLYVYCYHPLWLKNVPGVNHGIYQLSGLCPTRDILQKIRAWARTYIDDIICRARSFSDLLKKLRIFFDIFFEYNNSIKPTKFFLNYPYVGLLGQQVNSLGLTTMKEKLWTIKHLTYSETLGALKYYLGLTSYLRNYIYFYTKLAAPL